MSASPRAKTRRLAVTALALVAATAFLAGTATAAVTAFSNTDAITIPDLAAATPYPSTINVSGLTGTVTKVTVTLNNLSHTGPSDIDALLVAPDGKTVLLMSDAGGGTDAVNLTITFDDAAAGSLVDPLESGTFKPTNLDDTTDVLPPPAPAGPFGATLSVLNGSLPNGTWQLFIRDDENLDSGAIAGGWTLTLTTRTNFIAVGAGAGGGPHVRIIDVATLAPITEFFAYDGAFTGGVRVATGDVNGDGVVDLITAPGAGGGPHVRVFNGALLSVGVVTELFSLFAYDPGFTGGVFVASADMNNDGKADIITAPGAGGGPHVRVFSGADGSEITGLFVFDPGFTGGIFVGADGF